MTADGFFGGGFALFISAVLLYMAISGAQRGEVYKRFGNVKRSAHPILFWFLVTVYGLMGVALVLAAFGMMIGG